LSESLFHLANPLDAAVLQTGENYTTASLQAEGFIHCCTETQLPGVLQRYYQDANELVLLNIDPSRLFAKLVFENTVGGAELFPHVYGPVNATAVIGEQVLGRLDIERLSST